MCPARCGAFLLVAGRRDQLAAVLLRAPNVDERPASAAPSRVEHLVPAGPDRLVAVRRACTGRPQRPGDVGRQLAALVDPLLAAAVQDPHVVVAVELQIPVGVGGEPVVLVAVEDDGRVVADSALAEQPLERRPCRRGRARQGPGGRPASAASPRRGCGPPRRGPGSRRPRRRPALPVRGARRASRFAPAPPSSPPPPAGSRERAYRSPGVRRIRQSSNRPSADREGEADERDAVVHPRHQRRGDQQRRR